MNASLESGFAKNTPEHTAFGGPAHPGLVHLRWPLWCTKRATKHADLALPTARRERCHNGTQAR